MKLSTFLLGLVFASAIVIGMTSLFTSMAIESNYNFSNSDLVAFNGTFADNFNTLQQTTNTGENITAGANVDLLGSDIVGGKSAVSVAKLSFNSLDLARSIFSELQLRLGLPNWFIVAIITALTIVLIFLVARIFASRIE